MCFFSAHSCGNILAQFALTICISNENHSGLLQLILYSCFMHNYACWWADYLVSGVCIEEYLLSVGVVLCWEGFFLTGCPIASGHYIPYSMWLLDYHMVEPLQKATAPLDSCTGFNIGSIQHYSLLLDLVLYYYNTEVFITILIAFLGISSDFLFSILHASQMPCYLSLLFPHYCDLRPNLHCFVFYLLRWKPGSLCDITRACFTLCHLHLKQ